MRAYRRKYRRRRYERTCTCRGRRTWTAPPPRELIPKGRYGISLWVEMLLDKFFSLSTHRAFAGFLAAAVLNLAAGTVADGLQRLEVLLRPLPEAIKQRNPQGDLHQGDETRWRLFVPLEGKEGYNWWFWVVGAGPDTVAYLLEPSRGHTVPREPPGDPVAWGAGGRSLCGVQGDELGQGRSDRSGLLLVPCAAGFHPSG